MHQVELEIQNEELSQSRTRAEEARDRYRDLYDFAPVGYFTIDEHSRIVEANLTGCQMLQVERQKLLKKTFTKYIDPEDADVFYFYRQNTFDNSARQTRELTMLKSDGTSFIVQLEVVKAGEGKFRIAVIDITEREQAEEKLKQAHETLLIVNQRLEKHNRQNSTMSEMRELLQSCSNIEEIPPIIKVSITKVFPDTDGALFLINNSRTKLQSVARWGDFPEGEDENIFKPDAC